MYNDVAYLVPETVTKDENFNPIIKKGEPRMVYVKPKSVGMREFYAAATTDFHPDLVLVLADYLDYDGEKLIEYNDKPFNIVRTYRNGLELELTLEERIATNE